MHVVRLVRKTHISTILHRCNPFADQQAQLEAELATDNLGNESEDFEMDMPAAKRQKKQVVPVDSGDEDVPPNHADGENVEDVDEYANELGKYTLLYVVVFDSLVAVQRKMAVLMSATMKMIFLSHSVTLITSETEYIYCLCTFTPDNTFTDGYYRSGCGYAPEEGPPW